MSAPAYGARSPAWGKLFRPERAEICNTARDRASHRDYEQIARPVVARPSGSVLTQGRRNRCLVENRADPTSPRSSLRADYERFASADLVNCTTLRHWNRLPLNSTAQHFFCLEERWDKVRATCMPDNLGRVHALATKIRPRRNHSARNVGILWTRPEVGEYRAERASTRPPTAMR